MKLIHCSAVLLATLALAPLMANAESVDLFTGSGAGNYFTFTLPANPVDSAVLDPLWSNNAFYIVDVPITFDSKTSNETVEFYMPSNYGGMDIFRNGTTEYFHRIDLYGTQLFTGPASDPTFTLGTFTLPNNDDENALYTLTISAVPVAPTPEPSALVLLATGLAGMYCIVRRKTSHHLALPVRLPRFSID